MAVDPEKIMLILEAREIEQRSKVEAQTNVTSVDEITTQATLTDIPVTFVWVELKVEEDLGSIELRHMLHGPGRCLPYPQRHLTPVSPVSPMSLGCRLYICWLLGASCVEVLV